MDPVPINPMVQQSVNMQRRPGYGFQGYLPQGGQYMRPLNMGGYPFGAAYGGRGQLPPRFTWGGPNSTSQPQQGQQFPFQLPQSMGLGDFYTPHGMGDAQNVPNSGPSANFIGNQWGQTPGGQQSQYLPPLPRGFGSLPMGRGY